jgi:hypothetical protein
MVSDRTYDRVLWAPCGEKSRIATVSDTSIGIYALDAGNNNIEVNK